MCELYSHLLQKCIKKKLLYTDGWLKDISDLLKIDVTKKENQKPLTLTEMGTQSRFFLCWKRKRWIVSNEMCSVLCNATCYLKDNFPFDKPILK